MLTSVTIFCHSSSGLSFDPSRFFVCEEDATQGLVEAHLTGAHLGETGPLSQGVRARMYTRKALRIYYTNGTEVRKKRPRGFKNRSGGSSEPPEPPICFSLARTRRCGAHLRLLMAWMTRAIL
jgi:hypothetical protein